MSEEIEDNDNLEPDDRASTEPPTVFAAGQTAGNLPKKTANKLDWMMPDYADEDARRIIRELDSAGKKTDDE